VGALVDLRTMPTFLKENRRGVEMGNRTFETSRRGRTISYSTQISLTPLRSQGPGVILAQEGYRAKFYEKYRKEAEEYDKEFLKKYDEDLNTTLIFVSSVSRVRQMCAD
jgi:hypothetical protein